MAGGVIDLGVYDMSKNLNHVQPFSRALSTQPWAAVKMGMCRAECGRKEGIGASLLCQ